MTEPRAQRFLEALRAARDAFDEVGAPWMLLVLHGPALDLPRVRRVVREFSDALEDEARFDSFTRLLERAGLE